MKHFIMDIVIIYLILFFLSLKFKYDYRILFVPIITGVLFNIVAPYYNFGLSSADFAHFDYTIWNSANFRGLDLSIGEDYLYYRNLLGNHFSPSLFLVSIPQFFIQSHIYLPLVSICTFLFSLYLIFKIALRVTKDRFQSALLSSAFLCSKYFSKVINYEFHHEILYIPATLALFLIHLSKPKYHRVYSIIACVFIIFLKEDSWFLISGLALYIGFTSKKLKYRILSWSLLPTAAISLLITLKYVMPSFHKPGFPPDSSTFLSLWSTYGDTATSAFIGMITNPHLVITDIFTNKTFYYLLAPILFIPLTNLSFLLFTPALLIHLLSSYPLMKHLLIYYSSPILGLVLISFFISLQRFEKKKLLIKTCTFLLLITNVGNFRIRTFNPFSKENNSLAKLNEFLKNLNGQIYILGSTITRVDYSLNIKRFTSINQMGKINYLVYSRIGNMHPFDVKDIEDLYIKYKKEIIYDDSYFVVIKP